METVHNAAVVKHKGECTMLFLSHLRIGHSIIGLARGPYGIHFTADPQRFLTPAKDGLFASYEEFGVEDSRVTLVHGSFIIAQPGVSPTRIRRPRLPRRSWMRYEDLDLKTVFRRALAVVGPGRLLFSTDSSFFPRGWNRGIYDEQTRILAALDLSADAQLVFGGNLERLLNGLTGISE